MSGGSPIGYTVVEPSFFGNDFLVLIVVGAEHRNAGIGQLLMGDVEARERDTKLFTSTNLSNQVMQRLLGRRGWHSSGMVFGLDEGDPEPCNQFRSRPAWLQSMTALKRCRCDCRWCQSASAPGHRGGWLGIVSGCWF